MELQHKREIDHEQELEDVALQKLEESMEPGVAPAPIAGHQEMYQSDFAARVDELTGCRGLGGDVSRLANELNVAPNHQQDVPTLSYTDLNGERVQVANTPGGVEMGVNMGTANLIAHLDSTEQGLEPGERIKFRKKIVDEILPGDRLDRRGIYERIENIRVKPAIGTEERRSQAILHGSYAALTGTITGALNLAVTAGNILESMTTPVGVDGAQPMGMVRNEFLRRFNNERQSHDLKDIVRSMTKSELLIRQCYDAPIDQDHSPSINAGRAEFLQDVLDQKRTMDQVAWDRESALNKCAFEDKQRIEREHDQKLEDFKETLMNRSHLESKEDHAFAKRLFTKIEDDPLVFKCLDRSINGIPLAERIHQKGVENAFSRAFLEERQPQTEMKEEA